MDKLKVEERFETGEIESKDWPNWFRRVILWIEKDIFKKISVRINFLLSRVNDQKLEIVADGNTDENQDGNWRWRVDGDDLVAEKRINGTWVETTKIHGS